MEIVLLWTIWATAFTAPPELDVLEQLCRRSHPDGRITISRELLSWNERHYPAAMIICARPEMKAGSAEPGAVLPREADPMESEPRQSAPQEPQPGARGAKQSI